MAAGSRLWLSGPAATTTRKAPHMIGPITFLAIYGGFHLAIFGIAAVLDMLDGQQ